MMMVEDHQQLNRHWVTKIDMLKKHQKWLPSEKLGDPGYGQHAQSPSNLHEVQDFEAFVELALAASRSVLGFLNYQFEDCYLTDCWANVGDSGDTHRQHIHPNNFLSGVYYAEAPVDCGDIIFDDPRPQAKVIMPRVKELTPYNAHEFRVSPKPGMLLLFPSWLAHRVGINTADGRRVSISFNVMLKGEIGFEKASASF